METAKRFLGRVEAYRRYRPGYPRQIVLDLMREGIIAPGSIVADIGSGTGLLAREFLEERISVVGVEPNEEMRIAGDEELRAFPDFRSMHGTAEATTLAEESIDLVAAGQAFHWFDREKARAEFMRILRGRKWAVLVWNERTTRTPFLRDYESMLHKYSGEYARLDHRNITPEVIGEFFGHTGVQTRSYPNVQMFDWEGLWGRVMSSSYVPTEGKPGHAELQAELKSLFVKEQQGGRVAFEYDTKIYLGALA